MVFENCIFLAGNINTALHPPFSLCPSPMLSPIPCKSKAKKTIQKDPLTMVVDSPLSSTTSSIHQQSNKNAKTDVEDPQINHSGGDEDESNSNIHHKSFVSDYFMRYFYFQFLFPNFLKYIDVFTTLYLFVFKTLSGN